MGYTSASELVHRGRQRLDPRRAPPVRDRWRARAGAAGVWVLQGEGPGGVGPGETAAGGEPQ